MAADPSTLAGWLPGHDARWVIATVLVVAGLLWMKSDGLESRLDDVNGRIDDMNGRIEQLRADMNRQLAELRTDLRRIDDRLRAVEIAVGPAVTTPRQPSPP